MRVDPHTFAENFIPEDHFKSQARARGVELGTVDTTPGAGAFLKLVPDQVWVVCGYLMECFQVEP